MTSYLRCPYSYWLFYSKQISRDEIFSPFTKTLLQDGIQFEETIRSRAIEVPEIDSAEYQTLDVTILNSSLFENRDLKLRGIPDGIETAEGALIPIEIKSHAGISRLDKLELAFYWLLLEPLRKRKDLPPQGILYLRENDELKVLEKIELSDDIFEQVRVLLKTIRKAQRTGVTPRICACFVCGNRKEVIQVAKERKDLTMINGISQNYSKVLENQGIKSWNKLLTLDSGDLLENLRNSGSKGITISKIDDWKLHAKSLKSGRIVRKPEFTPLTFPNGYIALDLEYNPFIWLFGATFVDGKNRVPIYLWADNEKDEKKNLKKFVEFINRFPNAPLATWNGNSADIPQIRNALDFYNLKELINIDARLHTDLYLWVNRNIRLPIPRFTVKAVGDYLGYPRVTEGIDGMLAPILFQEYLESESMTLKEKLMDYGKDDVNSLIHIVESLLELSLS